MTALFAPDPAERLREAGPLVRGEGLYTGDVSLPDDALALAFVRSAVGPGHVTSLDVTAARTAPGVVAVITANELGGPARLPMNPVLPLAEPPNFPLLADGFVAAPGQAVAAVLARTRRQAVQATEMVDVQVAPETWPCDREVIAEKRWQTGDIDVAFADAAHIVAARINHPSLAPSPLEPRSVAIRYEPSCDGLTVWLSTQTPHRTRTMLDVLLSLPPGRLRVIAPDTGGAFGMKASISPEEAVAAWAALTYRCSVRWVATRSEEFLAAPRGRGLATHGQLAVGADGRFLGLKAWIEAPLGHWCTNSALVPAWNAARILPGGYAIPAVDLSTKAYLSAAPCHSIYRGAGRPEAAMLMERLADAAARAVDRCRLDTRRVNLLTGRHMPRCTPTGNILDTGNYRAMLAHLIDSGLWPDARAWRREKRAQGQLAGLGIAFYLEPSGEGWESARVTLTRTGRAEVASGSSAQGQARATAYAQLAAQALDIPSDRIDVQFGDTATCPEGIGAVASRSTAIGGSAVLAAAREVAERRAAGEALPICAETRYHAEGQAWGYGVYVVCLTIDAETGTPKVHSMQCLDDAGRLINPHLVHGQIRGGIAQGLGEALLEEVAVDASGQTLSGSFMDYAMPRASDMPREIAIHTTQTPSTMNLLGAKGVGEAGTIGAPAALVSAALDALSPLNVTDLPLPMTPARIWDAIQIARKDTP